MNELVSIIITTYKRSEYIEESIKSAINQTYKNIEIIVVDDNANDLEERKKTKLIVEKYKDVIYIENKTNLGASFSRNEGIKKAKGKYIAFLDDDDMYEKNKIEEQYKLYEELKNDNIGMIYCYYYIINEKSKVIGSYENNKENTIYQNMLNCIAPTSLWFCKKEVLEKTRHV